ncbi:MULTISPECIES: lipoate--protein ligase family protein [Salimicrobium]|uniref:Octanoyl-[GcvH]:protein N-octanoyltransferase n=3 Tax=Salimicrobium TaxID=351195 RepID=K2H4X6_9BACI|nr:MULTISPECIES: biotin/lipoate A/B protein ligase family protein [Salimicrobium]AKG03696.1 octanoyltransferase [Salimicrobium jeotgali]EKE30930.1 lipoate-protein ligase A [Salimicrobium jeotgali]MBM7697557.1 lipoate-protein ligase A [Salimicrobium jeotgali]SDX81417.1 octanoyl-[GcvH]:protein N-octanoyltransferase [Salimicrobium album]SIS81581.1 octanoyl-[GcvH]:protein N-octanoyltransferase/lipoyl amidotransferase [Salimicrobium salexigens]
MISSILQQPEYRLVDHSDPELHTSALPSFAYDDALATSVGAGTSPATARLWVHPKTVVLGIPDARLPYISEGIDYLEEEGYSVVVRNSGGLAVVLDEGVLNLSLIFPETKGVDIHGGYDVMVEFIRSLIDADIDVYEISRSYCPGDYDLSIDGRKFAGISQRRVKGGFAVQIYLDVTGSGQQRAELIRNFYDTAKKGEETKFSFPDIDPSVMASLNELLEETVTIESITERIKDRLRHYSDSVISYPLTDQEVEWLSKRTEQMVSRNKRV